MNAPSAAPSGSELDPHELPETGGTDMATVGTPMDSIARVE